MRLYHMCTIEIKDKVLPWSKIPGHTYYYHFGSDIREERVYDKKGKKRVSLQRWIANFDWDDGLNGPFGSSVALDRAELRRAPSELRTSLAVPW